MSQNDGEEKGMAVKLTHCSISDKKGSNANANENLIRIVYYLAVIDKNLNALGHICII